jgi:hypothetical protein
MATVTVEAMDSVHEIDQVQAFMAAFEKCGEDIVAKVEPTDGSA